MNSVRFSSAVLFAISLSAGVQAQLIEGGDILLTDSSPSFTLDDSNSAGPNWRMRGDDNEFSILDVPNGQMILNADPSIFSTALGWDSLAAGTTSIALGRTSTAAGDNSVALGFIASAVGKSSVAIGTTTANGESSIGIGDSASAGFEDSIAIGSNAVVTAINGVAIGVQSDAEENSTSIGPFSIAGPSSTAIGVAARATGSAANAIGFSADAIGGSSLAVGPNARAEAFFSTAIGQNAFSDQASTIIIGSIPNINFANRYLDVGMGTTDPLAPLHIARSNGTARLIIEETSGFSTPRSLLILANKGNTKFEIENTDAGNAWAFTNSGIDFRVSLQDSGVVEFRVDNSGNAYVSGLLFELSDREAKQHIEAIQPEQVLEKVTALPISEWEYKDAPGQRHVGPMAQDFRAAFGLGADDKTLTSIDTSGVALASIQALAQQNVALAQKNRELDAKNLQLDAQNSELEQRLQRVEELLELMAPRVTQR